VKAEQGASTVDHSDLVELVADDLTQSVSRMLVEMGSEEGERFAKGALIKFAKQALSGASGRLRGIIAAPSDLLAEATDDTGLLTGHDGC
jgi:hypothetical protein